MMLEGGVICSRGNAVKDACPSFSEISLNGRKQCRKRRNRQPRSRNHLRSLDTLPSNCS